MKKGKYESPPRHSRRGGKVTALVLALGLLIGCAVGGTLAWLLDKSNTVTNTFTASDINIDLSETTEAYKMIPGHTISKDPEVTVEAGSEDCWLFVKVEESTTLDDFIAYAISDIYNTDTNPNGWRIVEGDWGDDSFVIGRVVETSAQAQSFQLLGAGSYTYNNGTTDNTEGDATVSWLVDQVGVKPEVTKDMMERLKETGAVQPTLTFTAYATQYWKGNTTPFTAADAWAQAQTLG